MAIEQMLWLQDWRRRLLAALADWKADPSNVRWQQEVQPILDETMETAHD